MAIAVFPAVLIASVLFICFIVWFFIRNHKQRESKELRKQFRHLGSCYQLVFSSEELLNKCMIGLDGQHRKLLYLKQVGSNKFQWHVISLDEVQNCVVKKTYRSIDAEELKRRSIAHYLEKVVLQFNFKSRTGSVDVPFYIYMSDSVRLVHERENKARDWEAILSKMLKSPEKKII